jgi:Mg2+ and Co2+ transporter CorA
MLMNIQIIQHLQSQATDKMEIMTRMSQKEAVAMRIITVVTLIFLPATFVSVSFKPVPSEFRAR